MAWSIKMPPAPVDHKQKVLYSESVFENVKSTHMHSSFFLTFYYDDFKTEKLKELYNEHLYLHHLDSTANIFF